MKKLILIIILLPVFARINGTGYTFAQWQALGYDQHSILLETPSDYDDSEIN